MISIYSGGGSDFDNDNNDVCNKDEHVCYKVLGNTVHWYYWHLIVIMRILMIIMTLVIVIAVLVTNTMVKR